MYEKKNPTQDHKNQGGKKEIFFSNCAAQHYEPIVCRS
jgi:hypothetical protein